MVSQSGMMISRCVQRPSLVGCCQCVHYSYEWQRLILCNLLNVFIRSWFWLILFGRLTVLIVYFEIIFRPSWTLHTNAQTSLAAVPVFCKFDVLTFFLFVFSCRNCSCQQARPVHRQSSCLAIRKSRKNVFSRTSTVSWTLGKFPIYLLLTRSRRSLR